FTHTSSACIPPLPLYRYFHYVFTLFLFLFFFNDPAPTEIYTLSLHDALPILDWSPEVLAARVSAEEEALGIRSAVLTLTEFPSRSEEHTSELQSRGHLVCRLLLEKKKKEKALTSVHT